MTQIFARIMLLVFYCKTLSYVQKNDFPVVSLLRNTRWYSKMAHMKKTALLG